MAAMEARLTKEVTRMRAQMMNFSNEGAEFSLNVPDTNEVKDVFGQVVTTVVQQQKQITTLQTAMKQMAEDHAASQAALINWTAQCVNELIAQNAATEARLQDAKTQLRNMSYNMQGFDDHTDTAPPLPPPIQIAPPPVFKTLTPKVIVDPSEVGDGGGGTLFPTETGAPPDASLNVSENPRWGGPAVGASSSGQQVVGMVGHASLPVKVHRKSEEERAKAKAYYLGIAAPKVPTTTKGKWRWAYRQVLSSLRLKALKVGMARKKLPLQQTTAERMQRMEQELFALPIALKEYTNKIAEKLSDRITTEVTKIETAMQEAREETLRITAQLQTNIDTVAEDLKQVDERLVQLKEQVDNASKQADEVERKLNAVISRVGEHEVSMFDSIKSRVTDLLDKVESLKVQTQNTTEKLAQLNVRAAAVEVEKIADGVSTEDDGSDGHRLFEMLETDTMLRNVRIEINSLDSGAFAIGEILRGLRYEVLSTSVLAGPEQPVGKDAVNELLESCDSIVGFLDGIFASIRSTNEVWKSHDEELAERWKSLSGVADAVKLVTQMSASLEEVRGTVGEINSTVRTLPSKDDVESISSTIASNAVEAAVQPIDQKIDAVESVLRDMSGQIMALKDSASSAPSGGSGGGLPSDFDTQLEPLIQRIVEMHLGAKPIKSSLGNQQPQSDDPLFSAQELELLMPVDVLDDETASNQIEPGTLVRVLSGEHAFKQGIVTEIVPASPWVAIPDDAEANAEEKTPAGDGDGDGNAGLETTVDKELKYRVSLSPSSPLRSPQVGGGGIEGLEPPFADIEDHLARTQSIPSRGGNMSHIQNEIDRLSRIIENLMSGSILPVGGGVSGEKPRAASPLTSSSAYRGTSAGVDAGVLDAIKEAIQDVLGQIGDLKELHEKELSKAKQQMKQAIINAVTKAIIDKDKEDKASFLTTKSMCVGCGRPSLVRREDSSPAAVSLGFVPGLNSGSTAGPDVYRAGFKLPVHVQRKGNAPAPAIGFSDEMFDEQYDEESGRHPNTISTSSEILAGMVAHTGVTNLTDVGAGGIAFTIAPCTLLLFPATCSIFLSL